MATTALPATSSEDRVMSDVSWKVSNTLLQNNNNKPKTPRPTTVTAKEFHAETDWRTLPRRLQRLVEILEQWNDGSSRCSEATDLPCCFSNDPKEARRIALTAAIEAHANRSFLPSFHALFRASLKSRQKKMEEEEEERMEEDNKDGDDDEIFDNGQDLAIFENIRTLGWVGKQGILMQPLGAALHKAILTKVRSAIAGEFEEEGLYEEVWSWAEHTVQGWLEDLVGTEALEKEQWVDKLQRCTAECFCLVRFDEIFDIVAEFPDSKPCVIELRKVLVETKIHSQLGDALRASLVKRLNHPGANTSQIIDCYINTIKVLREIESDGLLEVVTEPVRSYLRGRNDTVRCIITSLTDAEVGGDLYEELRRQDAKPLETVHDDSDDEEECPSFDWQPAPSITNPKGSFLGSAKTNGGDILSMLVSIYGSKELFVNEYRVMLADKLLANLDFNTDKEVHTLELLKLRFGEISMRNCEIMIKDMYDSKRANINIHSEIKARGKPEPVVQSAVISHIYWPSLQNEQLKHHPRIQADLDQYSTEFCRLKNPRRLIWLNQLGSVQLELDVAEEGPDGKPVIETREFNCSPLLATLISHFEDRDQWTAEDLSNETGIAEHIIQKRMGYWVSNRVVKIAPSSKPSEVVYQVASHEHLFQGDQGMDSSMMELDHGDNQGFSIMAQEEEAMGMYEHYVVGMLTNLGQLPLDKIHSMLKMYVSGSDVKFDKTPQQLSVFLKHLCKQEKLECGPDGMYKLYKK